MPSIGILAYYTSNTWVLLFEEAGAAIQGTKCASRHSYIPEVFELLVILEHGIHSDMDTQFKIFWSIKQIAMSFLKTHQNAYLIWE